MNDVVAETNKILVPLDKSSYEAPRVEKVLTPEAMEREILYAGSNGTPNPFPTRAPA